MGLSALGALIAIALAFLAQSPRLLARFNMAGQRLDMRARTLTGYGLALLLLAMGFFAAGVPLSTPAAVVAEASSADFTIAILAPGPERAFTIEDTIDFSWYWPVAPAAGEQYIVYLRDGDQEYALGTVEQPNDGVAYRLSVAGQELPAAGDGLTWQVRLVSADGEVVAASDVIPLSVRLAETTTGANGSQSGAMVGLATPEPDLTAAAVLTGTSALAQTSDTTPATDATSIAAVTAAPTDTPEPTATPTLSPTATPTLTPSPTPTPTPIAGPTARIGDNTSTLPVRRLPGLDEPVLAVLVRGEIVLLLSGHAFHTGDVWREISTVTGIIGWVPDEFLVFEEQGE